MAVEAMRVRTLSARLVRMMGTVAPKHNPGGIGLGQEDQVLCEQVAGFKVGHDQDLRTPRHRRMDALDRSRFGVDRIVHRQRPVEQPAGDLTAVGHLAENCRVGGAGDLWVDDLNRRQDRYTRLSEPEADMQVDRVLHDVALRLEIGEDVDRGVGDEQNLGIGRHVEYKDVADPPSRA